MPRRKGRKKAPDLRMETAVGKALADTYISPFFRLPKILASSKPLKRSFAEQGKLIVADVIGALIFLGITVYLYVHVHWLRFALVWVLGFAGVMIVPASLVGIVRRLPKRTAPMDEVGRDIRTALEIMDSTAKWYNNEDEANRELVTSLRARGIDATYQFSLPNGRVADARVRGVLVEGKLSPDTTETDRLLGQLIDYAQYSNKVNVVIYGQLSREARRRIENEIQSRYPNRVFLTYLTNPRRQRLIDLAGI